MYIYDNIPQTFFLECKMFQTKIVDKIESRVLCLINFSPRKSFRLGDNVEKYGRAGEAADYNITRRMCNSCPI